MAGANSNLAVQARIAAFNEWRIALKSRLAPIQISARGKVILAKYSPARRVKSGSEILKYENGRAIVIAMIYGFLGIPKMVMRNPNFLFSDLFKVMIERMLNRIVTAAKYREAVTNPSFP